MQPGPLCNFRFSYVENSLTSARTPVETKLQPVHYSDYAPEEIEQMVCVECGSGEDEATLLLCDGCEGAWHTACVGLSEVPEGDWFCAGIATTSDA
jgi:hypothetical protein